MTDFSNQHPDDRQPNYGGQFNYGGPGPGQPFGGASGPPPNNYLVWAILTTVLCCLPLGIVSIVKATNVHKLWAQGQWQEAYQSAESAKLWAFWGAVLGVIAGIVGVIAQVMLREAGSNY